MKVSVYTIPSAAARGLSVIKISVSAGQSVLSLLTRTIIGKTRTTCVRDDFSWQYLLSYHYLMKTTGNEIKN